MNVPQRTHQRICKIGSNSEIGGVVLKMLGLTKVLTLRKKKDEMMDCFSEAKSHTKKIKPKNLINKCGEVRLYA